MEGSINLVFNNMVLLAEKAGIPFSQFWAERVQQTYVSSITSLVIQGVLVVLAIALVAFLVWRANVEDSLDYYGGVAVCVVVTAFILAVSLGGAINGYTNPEYQTLVDVYAKAATFR